MSNSSKLDTEVVKQLIKLKDIDIDTTIVLMLKRIESYQLEYLIQDILDIGITQDTIKGL